MKKLSIIIPITFILLITSGCSTDKQIDMEINVVNDFVNAINNANVDKICDLITDDYIFIDSQDNRAVGVDNMRVGWTRYFTLFPDYKIEINETIQKDSMICLFGYASGTYLNLKNKENNNFWRIPAAWTAIVKDGKISQWQVYADNMIVMEIIKKNK